MGKLDDFDLDTAELSQLANRLKTVEMAIRDFRIGVDGDEQGLFELRHHWGLVVLKINSLVQKLPARCEKATA